MPRTTPSPTATSTASQQRHHSTETEIPEPFPGPPPFHLKKESFSPRSATPTYTTAPLGPLGPPPPPLPPTSLPSPTQAAAPGLSEFYQPPASTPFPQFVHGDSTSDFLATAEPPPGLGEQGGTLPAPLQGALQVRIPASFLKKNCIYLIILQCHS